MFGAEVEVYMIRGAQDFHIPVSNQDVSLKFYTETIEFKVGTDQQLGPGMRWIELLIAGSNANIHCLRLRGMRATSEDFSRWFLVRRCLRHGKGDAGEGRGAGGRSRKEQWGAVANFRDRTGTSLCFRAGEDRDAELFRIAGFAGLGNFRIAGHSDGKGF